MRQDVVCGLGVHSGLIMPPHWILKLPQKGRVKSSISDNDNSKDLVLPDNFKHFIMKPLPIREDLKKTEKSMSS